MNPLVAPDELPIYRTRVLFLSQDNVEMAREDVRAQKGRV